MGWFLKKSELGNSAPLYTLGQQRSLLLVGLGNLGREYDGTRHNIGFAVLEAFATANEFPGWVNKKDLHCQITTANLGDSRVILVKPTTLMNKSGQAVQAVQQFYKLANSQMVVVHDELAIPFGQIRTRMGGSSAGHNGIKSISDLCGEDFGRVRIGIRSELAEKTDSKDFVLGKFSKEEQAHLKMLTREASAMMSEYIFSGQPLVAETRSFL